MQIHIASSRPGSWVVLDDLAGSGVVFDGTVAPGETVALHNLKPIDVGLLVCRIIAFQPPNGIRIIHHVSNGDTLFLGGDAGDVKRSAANL